MSQLPDKNPLNLFLCYGALNGIFRYASPALPFVPRRFNTSQIAITRFFDGEDPDPVEEARTALESTPAAPRTAQNLMEDLEVPQRPWSAVNGPEPAPRIDTQPSDDPIHRPPFPLSIFFTPFKLLYRLLSSSFHLFGSLFPFLPRLLNTLTSPLFQRARLGSTRRRSLGPKDTAVRFMREFEEEYGEHEIPFLENGYNMALEKAHQECKFLLVILVSPEHDDTGIWVRNTLLSSQVVRFIEENANRLLVWGGNVRDAESYQVSNSIRCTKFPFAAVIVHTPSVSSTAMSVAARISGLSTPTEFIEKISSSFAQYQGPIDRIRSTRAEQRAARSLREEQDAAYARSLAQDRERTRQRREAEEQRRREGVRQREEQEAAEKYAINLAQWKKWRSKSIASEALQSDKDAVRISLLLPSGERVIRRFPGFVGIEELYAFVECYDVLKSEEGDKKKNDVEAPEGFEHKYSFQLVSPMPRTVFHVDSDGTLREKIGRGGNLLVESIEDEEEGNE